MFKKIIKGLKDVWCGSLEFDTTPKAGSYNPVTSGGVKEAISEAVADIPSIEAAIPEGAGEEDQLVKSSELNTVDGRLESVESKIPSSASSTDKLVTKSELDNATASMESGYTPKGPASVSTLNGLTGQENGDQYIVTDSGTLTDGSLAVTAGESVAWDSANDVWYKVNQYALNRFGTNEVKNLAQTASESNLSSSNYIPVDSPEGPKKLPGDAIAPKSVLDALIVSALHNIGPVSDTMASAAPYNDLDIFPINEVAISINSYAAIAHKPTDESFNVFTFGGTNGGKCQIVSTNTNKMYMRACWSGSWSDWVEVTETDPKALHNAGGINATMAAAAPYNDLNTFPINEVAISINSYSAIAHKPTAEPFNVMTFGGANGGKCQVVSTNTNKMYMRACWSGSWSDWVEVTETDPKALHNIGGINATMAAGAPYNDLNTFPINEVAISINSYSAIANKPTDEAFNVLTFGGTNGGKCQVVSTLSKKMFMRSCWAASWSDWVEIGKEEEDETFIDVLNQFDNIVCVGDSLTWSQVYTGANTSRQAKKTYPAVLGEITHATAQGLAYPGDKTTDAWNRWKDTFEAKTNALAVIFLGTNGGFTDTLSTDCPEGVDYTQWADTNTGCYGKIISKLKELGYKIILIQPFAVGQTSDLTITKKVVTDAGARFGCAVVQAFRTTDDKYHYYPDGSGKNTLHYNDFGYSWFAYTLCEKVNNLDNDNMKLIIPS